MGGKAEMILEKELRLWKSLQGMIWHIPVQMYQEIVTLQTLPNIEHIKIDLNLR